MTGEKHQSGVWLLVVLGALLAFASISTDLYLPAMPAMAESLGAPQSLLEFTVSGYLIGFSLGQLFWGPASDRFGRRIPVALGVLVFIIGSAGCALAASVEAVIAWRVVQALGASAGVVIARAMVRDLYGRDQAARVLSTLMTVMAAAPMLGPSVGAQILWLAGWEAIFWTLAGFGVLTLAALATVAETLPHARRGAGGFADALRAYGVLLENRRLLGYAAAGGFFYAGIFAYVAGTPFAFIDYHGLSPQLFGLIFATGVIGMIAGNTVNGRLVVRLGSDSLLRAGAMLALAAGGWSAVAAATGLGGAFGLAAGLFVYVSANGLIIANVVSGALESAPARIGAASALVGAIQYGSGVLGSGLVGALADGTPLPLGLAMLLAGAGTLASVLFGLGLKPPSPSSTTS